MIRLGSLSRIRELDALRGFAVGGIMLVNTWQHASHEPHTVIDATIEAAFQSRFYPIFSLLFGISFVLFLERAGRWVLLSRLGWLFVFGLVQHTWYEGEVLTDYAFYGLAVLLPASFLWPGLPVLLLGLGVTAWGVMAGGGVLLIPGMFLVGMALMQLRPSRELLLPGFGVSALACVLLMGAAVTSGDWTLYTVAALAGAAAYSTGVLLVLRPWLSAVLEPLGRMALTNYVTGTLVIFLTGGLIDAGPGRWPVLAVAGVTLVAQVLFSRWWLGRFRYGPLEWVWRMLTWFRYVPNRLESGRDENRPLPDPGVT
ncbi:DUF418 domain-containing protein [Nonomuraea sp. MCN248]|uniref:DUF418 domain-containing protein n=1 Tax=Nonomuraea corallina TaxID=2989783 RepID=A0ABT4S9S4_9ACTN|nr:DUF418 domain-containing protein [Nonomuraea corallina]MDA0633917.1 DUF418 domain-containing protein [Nonomuraea corallina]